MDKLERILNKKEKVLWKGRPFFWPFIFRSVGRIFLFSLIPILVIGTFLLIFQKFFLISVFAWILLPSIYMIPLLLDVLMYKNIIYAITDRRVILQGGIIGIDYEITDFDKITDASVNVDLFDNLFCNGNSGTIIIQTANGSFWLCNLENPYEVFKFFKKVSFDIKTDVHYPNKYRPKINPGYNTKYVPKK